MSEQGKKGERMLSPEEAYEEFMNGSFERIRDLLKTQYLFGMEDTKVEGIIARFTSEFDDGYLTDLLTCMIRSNVMAYSSGMLAVNLLTMYLKKNGLLPSDLQMKETLLSTRLPLLFHAIAHHYLFFLKESDIPEIINHILNTYSENEIQLISDALSEHKVRIYSNGLMVVKAIYNYLHGEAEK